MKEESKKHIADFFIVLFLLLGTSLFAIYGVMEGPVYLVAALHAIGLGILSVVFLNHSHNTPNIDFVFSLVFSTLIGVVMGLATGFGHFVKIITVGMPLCGDDFSGIACFGTFGFNSYIMFPIVFVLFLLPFVIYLLSNKQFNRNLFLWYLFPIVVFLLLSLISTHIASQILYTPILN